MFPRRTTAVLTVSLLVVWLPLTCSTPLWADSTLDADLKATRTTIYNPGKLFVNFTYNYALMSNAAFNDFDVQFKDLSQINTGSFKGPAGTVEAPPKNNPNLFVYDAPMGTNFMSPVMFSLTSVNNPKIIEDDQMVTLTKGGMAIMGETDTVKGGLALANPAMVGDVAVAFAPGTFAPSSLVDLFQSTSLSDQTAQIGFGTAAPDGSAQLSLSRPLDSDLLFVGEASSSSSLGTIEFEINPVPEPGALTLLSSGILGLLVYGWWRCRRPVA